jgi:hypothetical protein
VTTQEPRQSSGCEPRWLERLNDRLWSWGIDRDQRYVAKRGYSGRRTLGWWVASVAHRIGKVIDRA